MGAQEAGPVDAPVADGVAADGVPTATLNVEGESLWQWLLQPGVLEVALAIVLVGVAVFLWWRLAGLVQNAQARAALGDYLLGVEQALQSDLDGAQKRLERVLEQDPENHYARLLLGKVLGELGQAEQAHQQHLYLQKAFAIDSGENDLMLAQSLLAADLPAEAADVAEAAVSRLPKPVDGWRFVYRARLRCGDHEAAAEAGRKVLQLLREPEERASFERDLARTLAEVGTHKWQQGDEKAAQKMLREVASLDGQAGRLPLLTARLEALRDGPKEAAQKLLAAGPAGSAADRASPPASTALTVRGQESALPVAAGGGGEEALPMATFAGLLEPARWICTSCQAALARELAECPRCGQRSPASLLEPSLVAGLDGTGETMDRIDANHAHVQRLVQTLREGSGPDGASANADRARRELGELGERAVEELLRTAWKHEGHSRDAAIDVLRGMGPGIAPALFRASDEIGNQRLLPVGKGPATIVGRIVQGFNKDALPFLEPLFASSRPDHRRILIDYYLGLGDVEAFESVLRRYPPMEILHRCNNAEPDVLIRFLCAIPRGHFVAESLLCEPTFYRDAQLLAAVPDAADPEVLVAVMRARGPTRALVTALIAGVAEDRLAPTSQRVLLEFGEQVLEHVLQAFASPECTDIERRRLARVLCCGGAPAAGHIADSFGPEPTLFDAELRNLLVVIGDDAIDKLVAAYDRSGWLEKVSAGLIRRHNNRRVQIASALGELGTKGARKALAQLEKREKDDNLRLHLARVAHEAKNGRGKSDGASRPAGEQHHG
ncbi:MAG: tetratricopeptide repeat protein [Planctomycetota bacterium]